MDSLTLKDHQKKKNCESVKKEKFAIKIFFHVMTNEVLKSCEK